MSTRLLHAQPGQKTDSNIIICCDFLGVLTILTMIAIEFVITFPSKVLLMLVAPLLTTMQELLWNCMRNDIYKLRGVRLKDMKNV